MMEAVPGLLRLGGAIALRTTEFGITTTVRVGQRMMRGAAAGESPQDLIAEATTDVRDRIRAFLGVTDPEAAAAEAGGADENGRFDERSVDSLRERGAELLRQSADVHRDEGAHPAYARILENLAPDEARILRLLITEGPQPAVDVRSAGALGLNSELLSSGLNMIGAEAGCRRVDRVNAYLSNLYRLGLVWFSREQLEDVNRYHVLEAQPEVQVALSDAGRTRTVRRSIHLTEFGIDFCRTVLPLDTAEIDALPRSGAPAPRPGRQL
jgi:hypothetical protein